MKLTKREWKQILWIGVAWLVPMVLFYGFIDGEFEASRIAGLVVGAIIFAFSFTMATKYFVNSTLKTLKIELHEGEQLLKEGGANHFVNKEAVGGKLVLTDKAFVFKSHKMNIQNHTVRYELPTIEKITAEKTLGIVDNGIKLHLTDGSTEFFVVNDRNDWLRTHETVSISV